MRRLLRWLIDYNKVIWILIIGIFINAVYIAYIAFYPFKTVEFYNSPFPIVNNLNGQEIEDAEQRDILKQVKAGEVLKYYVDYCRHTEVPTQFTRTLRGPTTVTITADATATSRKGCYQTTSADTLIPDYILPGKYHLDINLCWQVTPLQKSCEQLRTQDFEVLASET